ncbi:ShlB/FhaC/HecB family hemolysin secretion/activation protein [Novosphingobium sp. FKTRR1]|uniref:ShlB/FhaC/HecB family hemolysin secretion/activation protein n=1 Tax=Novosphingobium sp. FKTRR1 TaxID=2879118 RepID=UPI001CEFC59F|nr:ShlB/FhaC/HecB family hemolysin secretion/activation protein [Novosphingobium sp. FKTRR1]
MRDFRLLVLGACACLPAIWPVSAVCAAEPAAAPAKAPGPGDAAPAPEKFFIQAFDVSGVTRLSVGEVERIVYDHAGPDRTKDDVEAARKALQDAYAAKGLEAVIVDVPVQDAESFGQGIVKIAVAEVPVGFIKVTDSRYHSLWVARQHVPSLQEGKAIDFKALQADVSRANRFPDRSINPEFKPGRVPGTVDVDLRVTDSRPLHITAELDNDNSPSTTPLRASASVRYTNLWQAGHTAALTYIVAPLHRSQTEVISGSYSIPLFGSPWSFSVSGYHSNSNVASAGGSAVLGRGYQVGVRATYQLPAAHTYQSISFGPDFKNFKQKITVGSTLASSAPIRYIPFEMSYTLAGATESTNYSITAGATVGLRTIKGITCVDISGVCVPADAFRNREQFSNENFIHANLSLDLGHNFGSDIEGSLRVNAQLADSHLITNEQFAAGGVHSVRGYYSAEAVGDDGISPSLELRAPSLGNLFANGGPALSWVSDLRFFGFADAAFLHIRNALAGQTANYKLIGVGGGVRVKLFDHISGEVIGAVPLTNGSVTKRGDPRVSFQVKGEF